MERIKINSFQCFHGVKVSPRHTMLMTNKVAHSVSYPVPLWHPEVIFEPKKMILIQWISLVLPFLTTSGAENGKNITADRSFELGNGLIMFVHSQCFGLCST